MTTKHLQRPLEASQTEKQLIVATSSANTSQGSIAGNAPPAPTIKKRAREPESKPQNSSSSPTASASVAREPPLNKRKLAHALCSPAEVEAHSSPAPNQSSLLSNGGQNSTSIYTYTLESVEYFTDNESVGNEYSPVDEPCNGEEGLMGGALSEEKGGEVQDLEISQDSIPKSHEKAPLDWVEHAFPGSLKEKSVRGSATSSVTSKAKRKPKPKPEPKLLQKTERKRKAEDPPELDLSESAPIQSKMRSSEEEVVATPPPQDCLEVEEGELDLLDNLDDFESGSCCNSDIGNMWADEEDDEELDGLIPLKGLSEKEVEEMEEETGTELLNQIGIRPTTEHAGASLHGKGGNLEELLGSLSAFDVDMMAVHCNSNSDEGPNTDLPMDEAPTAVPAIHVTPAAPFQHQHQSTPVYHTVPTCEDHTMVEPAQDGSSMPLNFTSAAAAAAAIGGDVTHAAFDSEILDGITGFAIDFTIEDLELMEEYSFDDIPNMDWDKAVVFETHHDAASAVLSATYNVQQESMPGLTAVHYEGVLDPLEEPVVGNMCSAVPAVGMQMSEQPVTFEAPLVVLGGASEIQENQGKPEEGSIQMPTAQDEFVEMIPPGKEEETEEESEVPAPTATGSFAQGAAEGQQSSEIEAAPAADVPPAMQSLDLTPNPTATAQSPPAAMVLKRDSGSDGNGGSPITTLQGEISLASEDSSSSILDGSDGAFQETPEPEEAPGEGIMATAEVVYEENADEVLVQGQGNGEIELELQDEEPEEVVDTEETLMGDDDRNAVPEEVEVTQVPEEEGLAEVVRGGSVASEIPQHVAYSTYMEPVSRSREVSQAIYVQLDADVNSLQQFREPLDALNARRWRETSQAVERLRAAMGSQDGAGNDISAQPRDFNSVSKWLDEEFVLLDEAADTFLALVARNRERGTLVRTQTSTIDSTASASTDTTQLEESTAGTRPQAMVTTQLPGGPAIEIAQERLASVENEQQRSAGQEREVAAAEGVEIIPTVEEGSEVLESVQPLEVVNIVELLDVGWFGGAHSSSNGCVGGSPSGGPEKKEKKKRGRRGVWSRLVKTVKTFLS